MRVLEISSSCVTRLGFARRSLGAYNKPSTFTAYQNARIEHDKALARVVTAVLKDDTELFKQFMDNESFRQWVTDTVVGLTYSEDRAGSVAL